jgi:signal transduction histidine kinase
MRGRAHRMENLINGILEYSKVGRKEVATEKFAVKELLEEIIDSLAPSGKFTVELPQNAPVLTTEKIFMQQVFTNLISNGLKYNDKPEGVIKISLTENPAYFEFIVRDNGPGIPEKYHDRIFGIFQTMESRDTRESTGVGLAIVKKIIDEKGGTIKVESVENEYTEFIFTWPKESGKRY